MCIIALSPAGVELPDEEDIKHMFRRNPDGAGFAIQGDIDGDGVFKVKYQKGFMNVDDFIEALGPRDKLKDFNVAMHFRIKTHGNVDKGTTHPFPLSNQYNDLRQTEGRGPVLFHNGTFSGLGGKSHPDASDTQDFVIGVAMKYLHGARMPGAVAQAVVNQIAGACRVLIMYEKENFPLLKLGQWYEHKGNWYSNMGYRDETTYGGVSYSNSSYHYHKPSYQSSICKYRELDEWGCNIAEQAWPDKTGWIRCESQARFDKILEYGKERRDRNGVDSCLFAATQDTVWYINEDMWEFYTQDRATDVELRAEEEYYLESLGYTYDEDYICFDDEEQMLDWMDSARPISSYEVMFNRKHWYIDTINLEAFTDEGIKKMFKTGEQGHVKKYLKEDGSIVQHGIESRMYGYPTDDDPDDATPLLGMGYTRDEEDETEEEYQKALKEAISEEYGGA